VADRAFLREGQAYIGIGDEEMLLASINSVNLADAI